MGKCPFYKYEFWSGDTCTITNKHVQSDIYNKYCRGQYTDDYKKCSVFMQSKSSGGCYLTTACVSSRGLPDDCFELETLRDYRDNWLANIEGGSEEIRKYYEIAPKIIEAIDATEERDAIYDKLYTELVSQCVELIQQKKYEEALELYRNITLEMESKYC